MAIKNVAEWFGKPIRFFKKKTDENFEERVVEILKKVLPDMLTEHDLMIQDKYQADREAYLQEIKHEVLKSIQGELGQVDKLCQQYEALAVSAKDVLREKIMNIYHKNKKTKTLKVHEKEALDQYYIDYKAIDGNGHIEKYKKRMDRWVILEDDYYDDDVI